MENRYLYRAKRTDNGEWIVGNRIDDGVTGQVFIHAAGNTVNESDKVGEDGCLRFVAFEVDPSTICQCTGIKDKNGKLIWENDIVKRVDRRNNRYIFHEQPSMNCKVVWTYNYGFDTLPSCGYFDKSDGLECEVIGNIFDEGR